MKRVLIFSTAYYPFVGGAEVAVKEIAAHLSADFEFELITAKLRGDLPDEERIGNILVHRIGSGDLFWDKLFLPFRGAIKAYRLTKEKEFFCFWGIMATFASGAGYICNIIRRLRGLKKIPIILTLQEGDSEDHMRYRRGGLIHLSWWLALKNTDVLTGLSNFLLARAKLMGYSGPAVLIPNGVNIPLFSQQVSQGEKEKIKKHFGKKDTDVYLITTSRLVKKNAVDDIISSLSFLTENFSLLVIGKGEEGPHLSKLADELGVANRVKFIGFVPQEDIPLYFSICDIFVRPSRSEGFGNSFIEAMAARLPVIATPVGGIVDFLDDKETGVFCCPDNPKSLAEAISLLTDDKALSVHIVRNAYDRVVSQYSWDHVADEMGEVFKKIVK